MAEIARKTRVIEGVAPDAIPYDALMSAEQPAILKGVVRDWPEELKVIPIVFDIE